MFLQIILYVFHEIVMFTGAQKQCLRLNRFAAGTVFHGISSNSKSNAQEGPIGNSKGNIIGP